MNKKSFRIGATLPSLVILFLLLFLSNGLLLTAAGSLSRIGGAALLLLLPGLAWAESLRLGQHRLERWSMGMGLSYALAMLGNLLLYYGGGLTSAWIIGGGLNGFTLLALAKIWFLPKSHPSIGTTSPQDLDSSQQEIFFNPKRSLFSLSSSYLKLHLSVLCLLIIIVGAAIFRFSGLGYSEFQNDETVVMMFAAEALEGRPEAMFMENRKGPGQILLPMTLWQLTGTIDEFSARLPFALAGLFTVVAIYLLGCALLDEKAGLLAAALMALNGLMVAFSRIVQYQQVVIWMICLSLLCAWEWRKQGQIRWAILMGVFLGVGLLSHYDAILVGPALVYLIMAKSRSVRAGLKVLLLAGGSLLLVTALFFGSYLLSPQAAITGNYLVGRIGQELFKNKLANFFHVATLYDSSYYLIITGLLVLAFFAWALSSLPGVKRIPAARYLIPLVIAAVVLGLAWWPNVLYIGGVNLAFMPLAVIFLAVLGASVISTGQRTITLWLAAAFMGYNFMVVDPGTHIYTIFPAWLLLAGQTSAWLWDTPRLNRPYLRYGVMSGGILLVVLFSGYLYLAFLRQDVEFKTDWPDTKLPLYWDPYTELPQPDHSFGFVHKEGWKAIGGLYLTGQLQGDYQTNGKYGSSDWYTRHKLRGCYNQSKQFLAIKDKVIDPTVFAGYQVLGEINLPYGRGMTIYQLPPLSPLLNSLAVDNLNREFDRTAYPVAFVRPPRQSYSAAANLYGVAQLTGYEIVVPSAHPGGNLAVTLYWQALQPISVDLHIFVHLVDPQNEAYLWGQSDGSPACGRRPTSAWQPGKTIEDSHLIIISPNTPPGKYQLSAGMYLPGDNRTLPLLNETGQPVANSIKLADLTIQ